jgi:hypothetical protein
MDHGVLVAVLSSWNFAEGKISVGKPDSGGKAKAIGSDQPDGEESPNSTVKPSG